MNSEIFLYIFATLVIIATIMYFSQKTRNASYALLAIAFVALGIAGTMNGEISAVAAYALAILGVRKFKTKFDKQ